MHEDWGQCAALRVREVAGMQACGGVGVWGVRECEGEVTTRLQCVHMQLGFCLLSLFWKLSRFQLWRT